LKAINMAERERERESTSVYVDGFSGYGKYFS
jgi:hypothetical protein